MDLTFLDFEDASDRRQEPDAKGGQEDTPQESTPEQSQPTSAQA